MSEKQQLQKDNERLRTALDQIANMAAGRESVPIQESKEVVTSTALALSGRLGRIQRRVREALGRRTDF